MDLFPFYALFMLIAIFVLSVCFYLRSQNNQDSTTKIDSDKKSSRLYKGNILSEDVYMYAFVILLVFEVIILTIFLKSFVPTENQVMFYTGLVTIIISMLVLGVIKRKYQLGHKR